jgi:sec-independent protein translocase protein TatA
MMMPLGFIQNIGPTQLIIVLVIVLILFGSNKLPDLARSLGRSLGEFKKGREEGEKLANQKVKELVDDINKEDEPGAKPKHSEETKA